MKTLKQQQQQQQNASIYTHRKAFNLKKKTIYVNFLKYTIHTYYYTSKNYNCVKTPKHCIWHFKMVQCFWSN